MVIFSEQILNATGISHQQNNILIEFEFVLMWIEFSLKIKDANE